MAVCTRGSRRGEHVNQWEMGGVVLDFCRVGLHYEDKDQPQWWSPMPGRRVAVHPARAFGAPIDLPSNLRTRILYGGYKAEGSIETVAEWYRVAPEGVADAVEFEEGLRSNQRAA